MDCIKYEHNRACLRVCDLINFYNFEENKKMCIRKKGYLYCLQYIWAAFLLQEHGTLFFPWSREFYCFRGESRHSWRNNIPSAAQDSFIHHSIFVHAWLLGWLLNIELMITFFRKVNMFIPNKLVKVSFMADAFCLCILYNCWPDTSCTL